MQETSQIRWLMYCKSAICKSGQFEFDSVINWKWLESLCRCCFVPIIINSVLSEFNLSLLDFIHSEMSVRQSLTLDIDLCVSDCDSSM